MVFYCFELNNAKENIYLLILLLIVQCSIRAVLRKKIVFILRIKTKC